MTKKNVSKDELIKSTSELLKSLVDLIMVYTDALKEELKEQNKEKGD